MKIQTKKLYDCYSRLDNLSAKHSDDKDRFIKVTIIKDENGFGFKIHGRNILRDDSSEGAIQDFLNTYSNSSIEMILDELKYIPERYLGKDEDEFIWWRRAFTKNINNLSMRRTPWSLDDD